MKYALPEKVNTRPKTLAALLAAGASIADAARLVGVSQAYVKVLLKGDLFQYEVDEQRRALVGERLSEYSKLVSEQLAPNLATLIEIRDDPASPPAVRIKAVEAINAAVVARPQPKHAPETKVSISLSNEQKTAIVSAKEEAEK